MQDKTCPICGTELSGDFCAFCGYEASADYLNFRTLRPTSRNDHFDLWVWTARSGLYNGERVLFPAEGERFFFPDLALPLLVEHDHETGALLNEAPRFEDERSYLRFFAGKSGKQEDARMKRMLKLIRQILIDFVSKRQRLKRNLSRRLLVMIQKVWKCFKSLVLKSWSI